MTGRAEDPWQSEKSALRARLVAARAARPVEVRAASAAALRDGALTLAGRIGGPVCAYLPIGSEPGSPELVEALHTAGHEVLLPIVVGDDLNWARYEGAAALVPGPLGLREPAGPRLEPAAIGTARLVLVPALAAGRDGSRIGKGRGYYDRTLRHAAPGVPLVVVVFDEELLDTVPTGPNDHPVTAALLPEAGFVSLENT